MFWDTESITMGVPAAPQVLAMAVLNVAVSPVPGTLTSPSQLAALDQLPSETLPPSQLLLTAEEGDAARTAIERDNAMRPEVTPMRD